MSMVFLTRFVIIIRLRIRVGFVVFIVCFLGKVLRGV